MFDSCSDFTELVQRVQENYAGLPAQAQHVARWLVEHPDDVALMSAREQAGSMGVAPATLTRFAKRFGFAGYDALRAVSQRRLRVRAGSFAPETRRMVARRKVSGAEALGEGVFDEIATNIATLRADTTPAKLRKAAQLLSRGHQRHVVWMRDQPAGNVLRLRRQSRIVLLNALQQLGKVGTGIEHYDRPCMGELKRMFR